MPARPEYQVAIVNRQDDVAKRTTTAAQERVREVQSGFNIFRPSTWRSNGGHKYGEEYHVQRLRTEARTAGLAQPIANPYAEISRVTGAVDGAAHQAEANAAADAKIAQVLAGNEAFGAAGRSAEMRAFQDIEIAEGMVRPPFEAILRDVASGDITTEAQVRTRLGAIVRTETRTRRARRQARGRVIDRLFGKNATASGERAEVFADNMLAVGQQIGTDYATEADRVAAIGRTEIRLANTNWAADSAPQLSAVDRGIRRFKQSRIGAAIANETFLGAAASVGSFFALRGAARGATLVASAAGIGAVAGGGMAALEQNRHDKMDRAAHNANVGEYGQQIAADSPNQERLEQFGYTARASVSDMLEGRAPAAGVEPRGLRELLDGAVTDLNDEANQGALAHRVAEIQTRLLYSANARAGMIDYSYLGDNAEFQVDQRRWELVQSMSNGREALINALRGTTPTGHLISRRIAAREADRMIAEEAILWNEQLNTNRTEQDSAFRSHKNWRVATAAGRGAVIGFITGELTNWLGGKIFGGESVKVNPSTGEQATSTALNGHKTFIPQGSELVDNGNGTDNLIVAGRPDQVLMHDIHVDGAPGAETIQYAHDTSLVPDSGVQVQSGGTHLESHTVTSTNGLVTGEWGIQVSGTNWHSPSPFEQGLHTINEDGSSITLAPQHTSLNRADISYNFTPSAHPDTHIIAHGNTPDGSLRLDPYNMNQADTITLQNGQTVQSGAFAQGVLNEQAVVGTPKGDIATEVYGRQDVFMNGTISEGYMGPDGIWHSEATIHGSSDPSAEVNTPETYSVQNPGEVHISGDLVVEENLFPPIDLIPKFRNPLENTNGRRIVNTFTAPLILPLGPPIHGHGPTATPAPALPIGGRHSLADGVPVTAAVSGETDIVRNTYMAQAVAQGTSRALAQQQYEVLSGRTEKNNVLLFPAVRKRLLDLLAKRYGKLSPKDLNIMLDRCWTAMTVGGTQQDDEIEKQLMRMAEGYLLLHGIKSSSLAA